MRGTILHSTGKTTGAGHVDWTFKMFYIPSNVVKKVKKMNNYDAREFSKICVLL